MQIEYQSFKQQTSDPKSRGPIDLFNEVFLKILLELGFTDWGSQNNLLKNCKQTDFNNSFNEMISVTTKISRKYNHVQNK